MRNSGVEWTAPAGWDDATFAQLLLSPSLVAAHVPTLALLLALSQAVWLALFRLYEREPRATQLAQQVVSVINLTRAALITAQPGRRIELLRELSTREGIRVYPEGHGVALGGDAAALSVSAAKAPQGSHAASNSIAAPARSRADAQAAQQSLGLMGGGDGMADRAGAAGAGRRRTRLLTAIRPPSRRSPRHRLRARTA